MNALSRIQAIVSHIPPLPAVALKIMQVIADPEFSLDRLVRIVRTDPALTARILKLCNSSLFSLPREVTTVSDAVAYLGTRNVLKLVVVSCAGPYFREVDKGYLCRAGEIWRHSVACAIGCQLLADESGHVEPGSAFTTGILHNLGKIAVGQVLADSPDSLQNALKVQHGDFLEVERAFAGIDHAAAGSLVADAWSLPAEMRRAIRNHHDPEQILQDGELTAIVHVADILALQLGVGAGADGLEYPLCEEALDRLQLHGRRLATLRIGIMDEFERSADLVRLDA
ncbi:MAG: HDOD domain-containing protein [Planctomycetes bacterium]|nr:HDOD domain-containing protein [Planctomycetota bacterium]